MMRFLLVIVANTAFLLFGFSQTIGEDIVELKSGESYIGFIIEQKPGHHISVLQLPSNDTLQFEYSTILTLRKSIQTESTVAKDTVYVIDTIATVLPRSEADWIDPDASHNTEYNQRKLQYSLSFISGWGSWRSVGLGVNVHYQITPKFKAGLGFQSLENIGGIDNLTLYVPHSFPVLMDAIYEVASGKKGRAGLFFHVGLGYNFVRENQWFDPELELTTRITSGLYGMGAIGTRINWSANSGCMLALGYQMIGASRVVESGGDFIESYNQSGNFIRLTVFF